jgi:poly(A) polymerase
VRMDLLKLLVARRASDAVRVMADAGLTIMILGGVPYLPSFEKMTAIEAAIGEKPDAIRRLGALAVSVAEDAERLFARLRLSNAEHERLLNMANRWWLVGTGLKPQAVRADLYRFGPVGFVDRLLLAWSRSQDQPHDPLWRDFVSLPARWQPPSCPIAAADLMERGVPKGPALGAALREAEAAWIAADFPADPAVIAALADRTAANHLT